MNENEYYGSPGGPQPTPPAGGPYPQPNPASAPYGGSAPYPGPPSGPGAAPPNSTGQPPYGGGQQPPYAGGQPPYAAGQQPPYATGPAPYNTVTAEQRQIWETKGKRGLVFGIIWFIAGLLITVITYSHASTSGGVYFVAWGPMVYGIIRIVASARMIAKSRN